MKMIKSVLAVSLLSSAGMAWSSNDLLAVYEQAVLNDPALRAERQNLLATEELPVQARAVLLPSIEVKGNTTKNKTRGSAGSVGAFAFPSRQTYNSHGYALTLRQPVYNHTLFVGGEAGAGSGEPGFVELHRCGTGVDGACRRPVFCRACRR